MNLNKRWILTCFGTAVGAGILFLPIQSGLSGIWSVIFLTLIILPTTYISHRGITRIVASCPKANDIIGAVENDLGHFAGFVVSLLYFLSIVTICAGYAIGLTNIVSSFLINQIHCPEIPRSLLTFIILSIMTLILLGSENIMITVTSILTFPLIVLLFIISIYMMPNWNFSSFHVVFSLKEFIKNTFLLLPILIFAMNFSPVCSSLGAFYKKQCGNIDDAIKCSDSIVKWNSILLFIFVMFFIFSLFFSITPDILSNAKQKNIDALTAISLTSQNPLFLYAFPLIAFLAIASSYFGHFTGTREGLSGIFVQIMTWKNPNKKNKLNIKRIKLISTLMLFLLLWCLAVYNPSILSIIGVLSAPIIATYAYLMPVILMKKIPRLYIYRSKFAGFVFIIGIFTIFGYVVGKII
ncbi:MAG: hypothetical protein LBL77_01750 [Endomicrobium sp.]|nr:hypothetical protein [Endomicrobium sp.]